MGLTLRRSLGAGTRPLSAADLKSMVGSGRHDDGEADKLSSAAAKRQMLKVWLW